MCSSVWWYLKGNGHHVEASVRGRREIFVHELASGIKAVWVCVYVGCGARSQ